MAEEVTVLQGFKRMPDSQALAIAGAVLKGLYADKTLAANAPVEASALQASMDGLNAAIAVQAQGGPAATVLKKNNRQALDALLRKLAHHVQANCNDDVQVVLNSGFQAKATATRSEAPPAKPQIVSVDNGHTTQLVVKSKKVERAKSFEARVAPFGPNNAIGSWQPGGVFTSCRSMTVTGLTPGVVYAVQVRAYGSSNKTGDWSDAVNHMCM